jgi:hypothetical protein
MIGLVYRLGAEALTLPDGTAWRCVSGGGRGREVLARDGKGRVLSRRVLADGGTSDWTIKALGEVRGGPLPPGRYLVHPPVRHPRLGPACFLDPDPGNDMHLRDDFWIHGPGPRGSDGCIVPVPDGGARRGIFHLLDRLRPITPCALTVVP